MSKGLLFLSGYVLLLFTSGFFKNLSIDAITFFLVLLIGLIGPIAIDRMYPSKSTSGFSKFSIGKIIAIVFLVPIGLFSLGGGTTIWTQSSRSFDGFDGFLGLLMLGFGVICIIGAITLISITSNKLNKN